MEQAVKQTMKRILAGVIAFAMIMTGNAFSVAAYAEETEIETLAEETTFSEEANSAGETEESPATDETMPVEDVNTLESSLADAESEILQESDEEDLLEETKEPSEETPDPEMLTFTAGNYSFGTDPVEWAQSGFNASAPKSGGCRIIAYSKMLVQTGAAPMSAVQNGSFNPGKLYDYFVDNKYVDSTCDEQGTPGNGAIAYAEQYFGTHVTIEKRSFTGTDAERKKQIVDGVNDGYVIIIGQIGKKQHFVCVDSETTKREQYPYLQESYSRDPGAIVRVENGNRSLDSYTTIRYCRCTDASAPVPTPTPGPTPTPKPTPTPIPTYTGTCGDNLTWELKRRNVGYGYDLTISGTGPMDDYGYYTEVSAPWHKKVSELSSTIRSVTIQNGVTKIGDYAFENIYNVADRELTLPESVTTIGKNAFEDARFTGALDLSHVTQLGENAFRNTRFTGVTFGNGLKEIPDKCFEGCKELTGQIKIPEGVTRIGEGAFSLFYTTFNSGEVSPARTVILPSTLKVIEKEAFYKNSNLSQVSPLLPANTERVGANAFDGCGNMAGTLTLPAGLAVGRSTFRGCEKLTGELKIPRDLWEGTYLTASFQNEKFYGYPAPTTRRPYRCIPNCCFAGCKGFTSIEIGEGIDTIYFAAFYNCSGLTGELKLPKHVTVYSQAFMNCSGLTKITIPQRDSVLDTFTTDPEVTLVGAVFEGCSGLTGSLTLSEDNVSIYDGNRIFYGTNLTDIYLEGEWSYQFDDAQYSGSYFKKKGAKGTFYSYINENGEAQEWEDHGTEQIIQSFPDNVTLHYDDSPYIKWGETNRIAHQKERLDAFGYDYDLYSQIEQASPPRHIVDAFSWDVVIPVDYTGTYNLTPYAPDYPDPEEMDRIHITVEDESIARIEPNGPRGWKYVPRKVGTTKYTVTINTYGHDTQTAYGSIRVTASQSAAKKTLTGISLNCSSKELERGDSFTLTPSFTPQNASNKKVTWESSDTSVATVTAKGVVKGIGKGEAVITVTTEEGHFSSSCTVTVSAVTYQVFFDLNGAGGSMDPVECDYREQYTLPNPAFQREGYAFGGWGTDASCATLIKSVPKYRTSDITVYARWVPWKYTVTYDANKQPGMAVSGSMAKTSAQYGRDLNLRPNEFVNKGYRFTGWTLTKGGTEALDELPVDEDYVPWETIAEEEDLCPDQQGDSLKLYAVWDQDDYSISYELNGGEEAEGSGEQYVDSYTYGIAEPIKLPAPVREGYKFEGWFTDAAFKKPIKQIDKKTFGDLTLYAKWSAPYKVILHDTESSDEKTYTGYTFNKEKALPANPFKSSDKAFMGWALTDDGEVLYTDKAKIKTPVLERVGNEFLPLTLYAVWKDSMSLDIRLDGGSYPTKEKNPIAESSYTYSYDDIAKKAITLPKTLIKDGYKFAGWYDLLTGKKITKIDKKTFRDYKLEAAWIPLTYQIVYNANMPKGAKGSGKMTAQKLTFSQRAKLNPNDFCVKGYRFIGWSRNKTGYYPEFTDGARFHFGDDGYKSKVTLYAIWERED